MKRRYGAVILLIFCVAVPTQAIVGWGMHDHYLDWHAAKNHLPSYTYGLVLHRDWKYYRLFNVPENKSTDFDIMIDSFDCYLWDLDYGRKLTGTAALECHILLLPVQINGSSYFEYLFAEKTSLETLTNMTIESSSIKGNKATIQGRQGAGSKFYDATYTWDITKGTLVEKLVVSDGDEFRLVTGEPSFTRAEKWGLFVGILLLPFIIIILLQAQYLLKFVFGKGSANLSPKQRSQRRRKARQSLILLIVSSMLFVMVIYYFQQPARPPMAG